MASYLIEEEYNPKTGVIEKIYHDPETDTLTVNTSVDVTKLLEKNNQERLSSNNGFTQSRDFRKIAELDMATVHRLLIEHNIDVNKPEDMPRLKQWLRDRDNRNFTTVEGKF